MFWLLHPGAVIGTQTRVPVPVDWRSKKGQFDVLTERTWPNPETSNRAKYTREHELSEFWQIFVEDRLVRRMDTHAHTFAQSKSVFSCAMTVMNKIEGWDAEEKWVVRHSWHACMPIYTKAVLCDGQESTQEYLEQRFVTSFMQENEVLVAVNHENDQFHPILMKLYQTHTRPGWRVHVEGALW